MAFGGSDYDVRKLEHFTALLKAGFKTQLHRPMTDPITTPSESVETLGYEWVKSSTVRIENEPAKNCVAVKSNIGWLVLMRIEKVIKPKSGHMTDFIPPTTRQVIVRPEEMRSESEITQ